MEKNTINQIAFFESAKTGVIVFKVSDKEEDLTSNAPLIKWCKFEYVITGVNEDNSGKKNLKLVDKLTSPGEMFFCLKKLLETYPSHQFQANWQNQQLRDLVENLLVGHAVAVHDYSENYSCTMQDQIQSLYFSQVQAWIHITILHHHALINIDGIQSMDENPHVITEHLFVISPDCKHDHHSVHSARKLRNGYLDKTGRRMLIILVNNSNIMKRFARLCTVETHTKHNYIVYMEPTMHRLGLTHEVPYFNL